MGWRAGNPDPYDYYLNLLRKGVPRYAASKALRAYLRRARRPGPLATRFKAPSHRHRVPDFCGACYERSKGR